MLPDILHDPFLVSTPIGDTIRVERVYTDFSIIVFDRVTYADLIESTMPDFDLILGMDCLHNCSATIDCRNGVVKFKFPNELGLEWEGGSSNPTGQ